MLKKSVDTPFTTTLRFSHISSLKGLFKFNTNILNVKKTMNTFVSQACVDAALNYLKGMYLYKLYSVFQFLSNKN